MLVLSCIFASPPQIFGTADVRAGGQRRGLPALRAVVPPLGRAVPPRPRAAGRARGRLPPPPRAVPLRGVPGAPADPGKLWCSPLFGFGVCVRVLGLSRIHVGGKSWGQGAPGARGCDAPRIRRPQTAPVQGKLPPSNAPPALKPLQQPRVLSPAWHLGMGPGPFLPLCPVLGAWCLDPQQLFCPPAGGEQRLPALQAPGDAVELRAGAAGTDGQLLAGFLGEFTAPGAGPGFGGRGLPAPLRPPRAFPSTSPPPARSPSSSARRCTPAWPRSSWTRWPSRWWPPSRAGRGSSSGRRLHSEQHARPELGLPLPPAPLRPPPIYGYLTPPEIIYWFFL